MSKLEDEFCFQLDLKKIKYEREVSVIPGRRYRWDVALLPLSRKILVEVNGGIWIKGGHSTGGGIERDAEKLNLATIAGYKTLIVTAKHIKSGRALRWVEEILGA